MPEPKKKRVCSICGTEHNVGEQCPNCEWNQEAEERRAKGELEREKIRESLREGEKKPKKSSGFWS